MLAAQYESWSDPIAVILVVPTAMIGILTAVGLRRFPVDLYTQIGLVLMIALAAKNAILIVEFARQLTEEGMGTLEAAVEATRRRFRPILMTSIAFILGVVPLMIATGAGAASQQSLGTVVFGGRHWFSLSVTGSVRGLSTFLAQHRRSWARMFCYRHLHC